MIIRWILITVSLCFTFLANAETQHLDDVFVFATEEEMKDLPKLLKQISVEPVTDENGQTLLRIKEISKGSVYDRMGLKVGDLVQARDTSVRPTEADFESSLE